MKKIVYFLISGLLAGCSGASPSDSFRTSASGEDSGSGGGDDGEGGGDDASSSSTGTQDTVSSVTSSSSSGSGQCQPSVTCQTVGAECGTILDDGCGNEIECPDNCTGFLTCGGSGDQFKCGCTALTCLDLGVNCGTTDDGCGGVIECGTCGSDPYVSCGGDDAPNEFGQPGEAGEDNVCGGGCTLQQTSFAQSCGATGKPPNMYICSSVQSAEPFNGCEAFDPDEFENPSEDTWCCP